jgi:hypothetical protein
MPPTINLKLTQQETQWLWDVFNTACKQDGMRLAKYCAAMWDRVDALWQEQATQLQQALQQPPPKSNGSAETQVPAA